MSDKRTKMAELESLRRIVQERPEDGEAWFDLGFGLDEPHGDPCEAMTAFERAQTLLPGQDLRLHIGAARANAGDVESGITLLQEYVRDQPSSHAFCILGDILRKCGRTEEARAALEQAISLDPLFEEPYFVMAELEREVDPAASADWYQQALSRDPAYHLAWQRLGSLLIEKRETVQSGLEALRKAIELKPEDGWTQVFVAAGLWRTGHRHEAIQRYEDILSHDVDDDVRSATLKLLESARRKMGAAE